MMTSSDYPYVKLRRRADGTVRPRFEPGPRERALGFVAQDLKHDASGEEGGARPGTERWFTRDEAAVFARARMAEISAARISGKRPSQEARSAATGKQEEARSAERATGKTVNALLDDFLSSDDVKRLAAATQADYLTKAAAIRFRPRAKTPPASAFPGTRREQGKAWRAAQRPLQPEPIALAPAGSIDPPTVKAFFNHLVAARGLAMARGCVAVLSAAFKWGRLSAAWRLDTNPCLQLELPSPATDVQIFEPHELTAMRIIGDATGDEAVVDAMILGLLTDQRPTDILAFTGGSVSEGVVRLIQSKTKRRVELPALTALVDRLAAMQARRQARGWTAPELVIDEATGAGFTKRAFNRRWRRLIGRVAAGSPELGLPPCPSIVGKKFKHLRKTTFTWLHRSGTNLMDIGSVSGHALASLPQVARHYLEIDRATAAIAMGKLDAYMAAKGVKL